MTKRSFFKSLASIVATVALAPEIAFRTKLAIGINNHDITLTEHINPAWQDAPYEVHFWIDERAERLMLDKIKLANLKPYHELQAMRKAAEISLWQK